MWCRIVLSVVTCLDQIAGYDDGVEMMSASRESDQKGTAREVGVVHHAAQKGEASWRRLT
jgi:hypothetical protein